MRLGEIAYMHLWQGGNVRLTLRLVSLKNNECKVCYALPGVRHYNMRCLTLTYNGYAYNGHDDNDTLAKESRQYEEK